TQWDRKVPPNTRRHVTPLTTAALELTAGDAVGCGEDGPGAYAPGSIVRGLRVRLVEGDVAAFGCPEDRMDLFNGGEEGFAIGGVLFGLILRCELRGLPKRVVEVGVLL